MLAGKAGYWRRTLDLLDELRAAGWKPDVFTYSSLIKACQICGNRWRDALLFMDEMKRAGELCQSSSSAPLQGRDLLDPDQRLYNGLKSLTCTRLNMQQALSANSY